jgi:hypothetical protein
MLTLIASALILVCGCVGAFFLGRASKTNPFVVGPGIAYLGGTSGTAYFGDQPLNRSPGGFAYSLQTPIIWTDSTGTVHEGNEPPPCLPIGHAEHLQDMEAVQYPIPDGGGYTGTILWVRC